MSHEVFFFSLKTQALPASSQAQTYHLFKIYFRVRFMSALTWKRFLGIINWCSATQKLKSSLCTHHDESVKAQCLVPTHDLYHECSDAEEGCSLNGYLVATVSLKLSDICWFSAKTHCGIHCLCLTTAAVFFIEPQLHTTRAWCTF